MRARRAGRSGGRGRAAGDGAEAQVGSAYTAYMDSLTAAVIRRGPAGAAQVMRRLARVWERRGLDVSWLAGTMRRGGERW